MKVVSALLLCMLLTACKVIPVFQKPEPYKAHCSQECFVSCGTSIVRPKLTIGSADECFTMFKQDTVIFDLYEKAVESCDLRRKSCADCLNRLKQAKVIQ